MFKLFKKIDDSYEFKPSIIEIEDRPQNPLGKTILWIVVTIFVFLVLWLVFAKIDIVVSGNGKVIPSGNIKILKPLENGIISKILVYEGQKVSKNEPLIIIDPSVSKVNLITQEEKLKALNFSIKRLELLSFSEKLQKDANLSSDEMNLYINQKQNFDESIDELNFKISGILNSINGTQAEISKLSELKILADKRVKNLKNVRDIIASKDYEDALSKQIDLNSQIKSTNENLLALKSKLSETKKTLENFKTSQKAKFLDELLTKQKEAAEIKASINALNFQTKQQIVASPVDGYVGKLLIHTVGSSVSSGEELISIIPANEPLIISAKILNKDIGFLQNGQKVAIKVDTFNFQKYGKIDGELIHIGNDAIKDEKLGEIFEIKVKPKKLSLMVEGKEKQIEPGMSVIAEVKVGKRRVIELFIYPIVKYLDEGLSVR
ncbi:HlyD family type I secretion periplasmic adaptor subunit [Campylobacter hominis]|uniref:Putative membrane-fusion protein n=1 Tax=Campylobacter hominis (strain ATCC BAA-381 / DSM 21671 / CCUG 45161 / LMG 19568 / NCTC 13146 / CH001A) TaxID=360107 RepID=A7I393_CAMHC|nr:HlyD family type I secretion periplasmic adaptor subunit [Campylobacter hominis]ABS51918.1 putative membrane-fusion protein [Campylobacter hominis ATCC BAA-381]UAK85791.1 HlyD family type I secretion periplasmic adaptor subunit [Campylobacter hominis]